MKYISHSLIVPDTIEERRYQTSMSKGCLMRDTLIILPTGLGKTAVAATVCAEIISKNRKVLLLAPTRPLVDQHYDTFRKWLVENVSIGTMNGNTPPERRVAVVNENNMIVATPQAVANDLENSLYTLDDFGLVIYDEAHRGVGNYAYVTVSKHNHSAISMGMTASPGSDMSKVMEVCMNLCFSYIDMRTESDADVSPYVFDTIVEKIEVKLPPDISDISRRLTSLRNVYVEQLIRMGLMDPYRPVSTSYLLQIGNHLKVRAANDSQSSYVYRGLVAQSIAVKISHAIVLVETQGMTPFKLYLEKLNEESYQQGVSKSTKELVNRKEYKEIIEIAKNSKTEHPKLSKMMSLVSMKLDENPHSKIMIFVQYRDTCDFVANKLSSISGALVDKLIGQSNGGLKQKEQIQVLEKFRDGLLNILVCTSVGEEGLDVSDTDLVIFYEPIPSEIRTIQRRGRTGRRSDGRVVVLMATGTLDEVFDDSSLKKEELMLSRLPKMNAELAKTVKRTPRVGQTRIGDF